MGGDEDSSFDAGGSFAMSGYITAVLVLLVSGQIGLRCRHGMQQKPPLIFLSILAVSCLLRLTWYFCKAGGVDPYGSVGSKSDVALRTVNRFALLTLFTAYSAYTVAWAEALEPFSRPMLHYRSKPVSNAVLCVIFNVVLYAISIGLIIATESDTHKMSRKFYDADVSMIAVTTLLLSLAFIYYGTRLRSRLLSVSKPPPLVRSAARKILVSTCFCGMFFSLRCVMFLWRPLTGSNTIVDAEVDKFFYPFCFYLLPDFVPSVVMVALMFPDARTARGTGTPAGRSLLEGDDSTEVDDDDDRFRHVERGSSLNFESSPREQVRM